LALVTELPSIVEVGPGGARHGPLEERIGDRRFLALFDIGSAEAQWWHERAVVDQIAQHFGARWLVAVSHEESAVSQCFDDVVSDRIEGGHR
jgi:hypothetical protein